VLNFHFSNNIAREGNISQQRKSFTHKQPSLAFKNAAYRQFFLNEMDKR